MSRKSNPEQLKQPRKNINLIIDGLPVTVPEGTRILEAAKKVNINIPTLCEHPDLCKRALCRICVVECDGRGKLVAACANEVWEGVNIVTNNKRLSMIRKTIIEMILADHPQNCLKCVRNTNCELQTLSKKYNISSSPFENDPSISSWRKETGQVIESETLVRDMDKCIKCTRCVEFCQEEQKNGAINLSRRSHEFEICTPFKQSLEDVNCVFCGGCVAVCPVGAIFEYDQSADVLASINNNRLKKIAQISPVLALKLNLPIGKLIAALKIIGFDKVYDFEISSNISQAAVYDDFTESNKNNVKKNPIISGCSEGVNRFIEIFYPNLENHLTNAKNTRGTFASVIKNQFAKNERIDQSGVVSVSFVSCVAQKYSVLSSKTDFALTENEFLQIIKTTGIIIDTLQEEKFDTIYIDTPKQKTTLKKEVVCGFSQARVVMDSIQKGECSADWIEILSCPGGYCKK